MLNSTHFNNTYSYQTHLNNSDILDVSSNSRWFFRIILLMIFALLVQAFHVHSNEKDLEIEEEFAEVEVNILPTFFARRKC